MQESTKERIKFLACAVFVGALALSIITMPASGQFEEPPDDSPHITEFLCVKEDSFGNVIQPGAPGYESAEYHTAVYLIQSGIGILMVLGPVAGILVALYATTVGIVSSGGDGSPNYAKMRRNALVGGFLIPIAALGLQILSEAFFPYNIGCIVPEIPI